jgi:hypothetical protein
MLIYHALFASFINILGDSLSYKLDKIAFLIFFILIVAKQLIYAKWLLNVKSYRKSLIDNSLFHNQDMLVSSNQKLNNKWSKLE